MDKKKLDFLIIGAAKTGTTSLFQYLRGHPEIHMPPEKEAPFFSHNFEWARGWDWYMDAVFGDAPADRMWGKVTPWYMSGAPIRRAIDPPPDYGDELTEGELERVVPERIRSKAPDVKLIAVLRDPVARCISGYRMVVKKDAEIRSFAEAVEELLRPDVLQDARRDPRDEKSHVVRGEYGRILTGYFDVFPHEQIKVVFSDELENEPERVVREIFEFIGVDPEFEPPNLRQRYHSGGGRKVEWLDLARFEQLMYRTGWVRAIWYRLPERFREFVYRHFRRARFRVYQWNILPREVEFDVEPETEAALRRHYAEDGRVLRELLGRDLPWERAEEPAPASAG
jgi:hypothetical protein